MQRLLALALLVSLPACVAGGDIMQESSRALARSAVQSAAQQYVPGIDVSPFSDCVINNADTSELLQLARSASQGAQGVSTAWPVVQTVVQRPAASQCLMNSISALQLVGLGGAL